MRFKAIAFDLDGTLYPESAINAKARGLVSRHPALFAAYAVARRRIRSVERKGGYRGPRPSDGPSYRRLQARMTAALLPGSHVDFVERRLDEVVYRELVELYDGIALYPGVELCLDALSGAGLRLALLSDLPPSRKLELMGLSGRFEAELCSEDSGALKPSAAPFRMLGASLGLPASDILYVGNSLRYDLAGAREAGMSAAIVTRGESQADFSFFDWRDLEAFALA